MQICFALCQRAVICAIAQIKAAGTDVQPATSAGDERTD
jgi:hypothetical protein